MVPYGRVIPSFETNPPANYLFCMPISQFSIEFPYDRVALEIRANPRLRRKSQATSRAYKLFILAHPDNLGRRQGCLGHHPITPCEGPVKIAADRPFCENRPAARSEEMYKCSLICVREGQRRNGQDVRREDVPRSRSAGGLGALCHWCH